VDDWDFHAGSPKDPADNTDEEKADMLEEYIDEDEFQSFEEEMWEIHDERQCVWLDQVCLCKKTDGASQETRGFSCLNDVSLTMARHGSWHADCGVSYYECTSDWKQCFFMKYSPTP
jgi:hypothetical protein